ncbi:peptide-methionine (R)-S-oxide reductase MsrB [Aureimonas fodinaquatilis]|uniref:peptide-methionine (R)-S-oxide reductase n=1 Tax=Aureimonas fodinaquatilis TaxID=2565783 RepID=A0A5B0DQ08_9HYPH|nr:peptide-methionine (R)-S-oxide reductase MsrB [Aureimonas fodinaquatilis]KAA0968538.1 peptide-methionine (R)-S-oxide reductase MsrB [Aureimonas fodinaquatilis]
MLQRRQFLMAAAALSLLPVSRGFAQSENFSVTMTDAEWRAKLTPDQFAVLRQEATERPFSSQLNASKRRGVYHCAGCDTAVYSSTAKYDSGTGWPSFYEAIDGSVGTRTDYRIVVPRTEVHCATCGGHLGHIFDDGPPPTGKRHCINGIALNFSPGARTS